MLLPIHLRWRSSVKGDGDSDGEASYVRGFWNRLKRGLCTHFWKNEMEKDDRLCIFRSSSGRKGTISKRNDKGWPECNVIVEEGKYDDFEDKAFTRRFQALIGILTFVSLLVNNFYVGEGSDSAGVPTKMLTVNGSLKISNYYQPRKSHRTVSVNSEGNKVPLYGAGSSLSVNSQTGGEVLLTLKFGIKSKGEVVDFEELLALDEQEDQEQQGSLGDGSAKSEAEVLSKAQRIVLELNSDNLKRDIDGAEVVLVLGGGNFVEALKELKSPLLMAKLDADRHTKAASMLDIKGFPTLFLFVNGSSQPYTGGFSMEEIVIWARKKTGVPVTRFTRISTVNEAEGFLKKYHTFVLGAFDKFEGPYYVEFVKSAASDNEIQFVETSNTGVAKFLFPDVKTAKQFLGIVKSEPERYTEYGELVIVFAKDDEFKSLLEPHQKVERKFKGKGPVYVEFVKSAASDNEIQFVETSNTETNASLQIVLGKTFDDLVLNSTQNVFLELHTPWCINCETTSKQVEKLTKHFKGLDNVFARLDAPANEHTKLQVSVIDKSNRHNLGAIFCASKSAIR
ncbi:hypothetical protein EZV62_003982 [Acer yangbiense]|uniref:Thioredoxin domain-containing protein n=1 Tax=Acer yangbiense TaxID=1000413 RepID=A0A5C7II87_9ROSI|nr:hypothetical protein EZV62_003982 [Acer yangbiense]